MWKPQPYGYFPCRASHFLQLIRIPQGSESSDLRSKLMKLFELYEPILAETS